MIATCCGTAVVTGISIVELKAIVMAV